MCQRGPAESRRCLPRGLQALRPWSSFGTRLAGSRWIYAGDPVTYIILSWRNDPIRGDFGWRLEAPTFLINSCWGLRSVDAASMKVSRAPVFDFLQFFIHTAQISVSNPYGSYVIVHFYQQLQVLQPHFWSRQESQSRCKYSS